MTKKILYTISLIGILSGVTFSQEIPVDASMTLFGTIDTIEPNNERCKDINKDLLEVKDSLKFDPSISTEYLKNLLKDTKSSEVKSSGASSGSPINESIPSFILPSPNSQSLMPKLNSDVDLYTGKVKLEYPIYTFISGDIELPIELNYSSNGVKVNSIASWVGTNWSLNAGGIVSRVVNGIPDESNGNMKMNGESIEVFGFLNIPHYSTESHYKNLPNNDNRRVLIENSNQTCNFYNTKDPKIYDTQQDEFYFNFGKYSGKFVFKNDATIEIIPKQNLIINKIISNEGINESSKIITGFTIITPDGTEYLFGNSNVQSMGELTNVEMTMLSYLKHTFGCGYIGAFNEDLDVYVWKNQSYLMMEKSKPSQIINEQTVLKNFSSTWYLQKINSPKGNILTLKYDKTNNDIKYITSSTHSVSQKNIMSVDDPEYGSIFVSDFHGSWTGIQGAPTFEHMPQNVKFSIYYNHVSNIVLSEISDLKGNRIEFLNDDDRGDLVNGRKLKRITIYDKNKKIKSYLFDYLFKESLLYEPYWVFFVAEEAYYPFDLLNGKEDLIPFESADHERMFLNKIIEYSSTGNSSKITSFNYNEQKIPRRHSLKQDQWGFYNSNTKGNYLHRRTYNHYDTRFDWKSPISLCFNLYKIGLDEGDCGSPSIHGNEKKSKAGILEKVIYPTGGEERFYYTRNRSKNEWYKGGVRLSKVESYNNEDLVNEINYSYSNGYSINNPFWGYDVCLDEKNNINKVYSSSTPLNRLYETHGSPLGYGIVKKIFMDGSNIEYNFTTPAPDDVPNTSAKIYDIANGDFSSVIPEWAPMNDFDFKRGIVKDVFYKNKNNETVKHINYKYNDISFSVSSSLFPLKFAHDIYNIFYAAFYNYNSCYLELEKETVKEYSSDLTKNNLTTTTYTYNDLGQVETINKIDSKNDEIQTKYTYPADIPFVDATAYILGNTLTSGSQLIIDFNQTIQVELFTPPNVPAGAAGNTLTLCFNGTSNRNIVFYEIETKSLDLPKGSYTVNIPDGSGGRINIYYKKYSSTGIKAMVDKNMISTPVEIKTRNTSQAKSLIAKKSSYRIDNPSDPEENWRVVPSAYTEKLTTESVNAKHIIYDKYDSYGNLLQFHKANDINNSYVWGYNGQYPIASVVNAMNQEIFFTSFEGEEEDLIDFVIDKRVSTRSHSGEKSLEYTLSDPSQSVWERRYELFKLKPVASDLPKKYRYSGWVYSNGPKPNVSLFFKKANGVYNSTSNATTTATNQWTYVEGEYTLPAAYNGSAVTDLTLWVYGSDTPGKIWFDDLRLYPADAQMTSYTYKPLVGMTSQTDPNGKTTIYDYDSFGRLRLTKDHKNNIMERYEYNYKFDQTYIEPPTPAEFVFNELNVSPTDPENGKVLVNVKYFNNGGSYGSINPTLVVESYDCSSGAYNGSGNIIFDEPLSISAAGQSYGGFTNEFTLDNGCYVFKVLDEATIIDFFELNLTSVTQ